MLEEEEFLQADIYLTPPNDGLLSDEDSDDEEGASADHLSGPQLSAAAEYRINYGNSVINSLETDASPDEEALVSSTNVSDSALSLSVCEQEENSLLILKPTTSCISWKKKDLPQRDFTNSPSKSSFEQFLSPTAIFDRYFDEEAINYLTEMTNLYAYRDKGKHTFHVEHSEMRLFLAMLLLSGYNVLPRRRMYWENSEDVKNDSMSHAMSRNRFEEILSVLHCCDNNNLNSEDKMTKVRPFYNLINERCLKYSSDLSSICVDESMLPYYGRHSSKQRIVGKPIRMGYKMWVLAQSNGYVVQFEPYQGVKGKTPSRKSATTWGLGERVVLDLLNSLPPKLSYHVFCDNFFTSLRLVQHLQNENIKITGTIRSNRLDKCSILAPKLLEKKARGFYDQSTDEQGRLTVVGWNDNRCVYVVSNCLSVSPASTVSRFCRKQKKRISVDQPELIKVYNKNMGGVDRCDQNISAYRISMKSKKWWWALFAWIPDMVVQNCWLLYRQNKLPEDPTLDLLAFRREIVQTYLKKYAKPISSGRPRGRILPANQRISIDVRLDRVDHYQSALPTQRRCGVCRKITRKGCKKCGCGLHDHCFEAWHGVN